MSVPDAIDRGLWLATDPEMHDYSHRVMRDDVIELTYEVIRLRRQSSEERPR